MRNITVNKIELAATIRANLDEHADQYARAMAAYEEKMREWFEENLARIKAGKWHKVQRTCPYPVPEEHTEDYQRVLDMLAWDTGTTYELDEGDFDQYVNNKWGWHRSFVANSISYLAK